ncbi:hypothetical protein [Holospora curviuscula]|uniref:Uncharacterized protein n=1 Tax=Holospora curviuscula TaxID=1082868 RepID=A0A2S5RHS7_9PROT|nr:hypothetical protein [Holospora curviuscula]PPE06853.1 hypothetical protein HCUR_00125 [Holospora curviuscula]
MKKISYLLFLFLTSVSITGHANNPPNIKDLVRYFKLLNDLCKNSNGESIGVSWKEEPSENMAYQIDQKKLQQFGNENPNLVLILECAAYDLSDVKKQLDIVKTSEENKKQLLDALTMLKNKKELPCMLKFYDFDSLDNDISNILTRLFPVQSNQTETQFLQSLGLLEKFCNDHANLCKYQSEKTEQRLKQIKEELGSIPIAQKQQYHDILALATNDQRYLEKALEQLSYRREQKEELINTFKQISENMRCIMQQEDDYDRTKRRYAIQHHETPDFTKDNSSQKNVLDQSRSKSSIFEKIAKTFGKNEKSSELKKFP